MNLKFNSIDINTTFQSFCIEKTTMSIKFNEQVVMATVIMKETADLFYCTLSLNLKGREIIIRKSSKKLTQALASVISETKLILRKNQDRASPARKNRLHQLNEKYLKITDHKHLYSFYHFRLN